MQGGEAIETAFPDVADALVQHRRLAEIRNRQSFNGDPRSGAVVRTHQSAVRPPTVLQRSAFACMTIHASFCAAVILTEWVPSRSCRGSGEGQGWFRLQHLRAHLLSGLNPLWTRGR